MKIYRIDDRPDSSDPLFVCEATSPEQALERYLDEDEIALDPSTIYTLPDGRRGTYAGGYEIIASEAPEQAVETCLCGGPVILNDDATGERFCLRCRKVEPQTMDPDEAEEHLRAEQLAYFRAEFPEATVGIESRGGGIMALAFRWVGDPFYYTATDMTDEALPRNANGMPVRGGWTYVCRYYWDPEEDVAAATHPDYEGTCLNPGGPWSGPLDPALSDEDVVALVRADRAARAGTKVYRVEDALTEGGLK